MSLNFGKLKQWTTEKLSNSTDKTDTSTEFKDLVIKTEMKRDVLNKLELSLDNYLKNMGKRKSGVDKDKRMPIDDFAFCMITKSEELLDVQSDSKYGKVLKHTGKAHEKIANYQQDFVYKARDEFYANVTKVLSDLEDYQTMRKKLEAKRLDLDSKLNRVQKAKKEKPELEEDLRLANVKYEDILSDTYNRMVLIMESEDYLVKDLIDFVEIEQEYHERSALVLKNVLEDITQIYNTPTKKKEYKVLGRDSSYTNIVRNKSNTGDNIRSSSDDIQSIEKKPSIPPKSFNKKRVECIYSFDAEGEDELSMRTGDVVTVIDEVDQGWWIGENNDKKTGLFPVNHTKPYRNSLEGKSLAIPKKPNVNINSTRNKSEPAYESSTEDTEQDPFGLAARKDRIAKDSASIRSENEAINARRHNSHSSNTSIKRTPPRRPTSDKPPLLHSQSTSSNISPIKNKSATKIFQKQMVDIPKDIATSPDLQNNNSLCKECDCQEYLPNLFKKGQCSNCFHKHN